MASKELSREYKRRKRKETEDAMMEVMEPVINGYEGAEKCAIETMVRDFIWYVIEVDNLKKDITSEGFVIEKNGALKENPKVSSLHKCTQRKGDYFKKLIDVMDKRGKQAMSDLDGFLNG